LHHRHDAVDQDPFVVVGRDGQLGGDHGNRHKRGQERYEETLRLRILAEAVHGFSSQAIV
jgi:hypothetical protein